MLYSYIYMRFELGFLEIPTKDYFNDSIMTFRASEFSSSRKRAVLHYRGKTVLGSADQQLLSRLLIPASFIPGASIKPKLRMIAAARERKSWRLRPLNLHEDHGAN